MPVNLPTQVITTASTTPNRDLIRTHILVLITYLPPANHTTHPDWVDEMRAPTHNQEPPISNKQEKSSILTTFFSDLPIPSQPTQPATMSIDSSTQPPIKPLTHLFSLPTPPRWIIRLTLSFNASRKQLATSQAKPTQPQSQPAGTRSIDRLINAVSTSLPSKPPNPS